MKFTAYDRNERERNAKKNRMFKIKEWLKVVLWL